MLSMLSNTSESIKLQPPYTSMINAMLNLPLKPDIYDYSVISTHMIPLLVEHILEVFPSSCTSAEMAASKEIAGVSVDTALVPLAALLTRVISMDKAVRDKAKAIIAPVDL